MASSGESRERLYYKLKNDLKHRRSTIQYDIDDLIEIYDYAHDVYDQYVQFEILLIASSRFPENDEFTQRRAYFYYNMPGLEDGAIDLLRANASKSALWSLLQLLLDAKNNATNITKRLDSIINQYDEFDDETAIQLVLACSTLDTYDWLLKNKHSIEKKCLFSETLLFEIAHLAEIKQDYATSAKLLEELTLQDPFNASYWQLLAYQHICMQDYENALNSIDYALAIDSDSVTSRIYKAQILCCLNRNLKEALSLLDVVNYTDETNLVIATQTKVAILLNLGREQDAHNVLRHLNIKYPGNKDVVDMLMVFSSPSENADLLQRYVESCPIDVEEWQDWAQHYINSKQLSIAADIYLAMARECNYDTDLFPIYEQLYMSERYHEVIQLYQSTKKIIPACEAVFVALSYLRTDSEVDATHLISNILKSSDSWSGSERLKEIGSRVVLKRIQDAIDSPNIISIDDIDPFVD